MIQKIKNWISVFCLLVAAGFLIIAGKLADDEVKKPFTESFAKHFLKNK